MPRLPTFTVRVNMWPHINQLCFAVTQTNTPHTPSSPTVNNMTRQETFTEPDDIDAPYECSWETRTLNPRKIHEKKGRQCFAKTSQKIFVASVVISMCVCYMYNLDNIQRWLKSKYYWIDVALLWALPTRLISVCTHGYTYDCKTFFPTCEK